MSEYNYRVGPNVEVLEFNTGTLSPYDNDGNLSTSTGQPRILSFWEAGAPGQGAHPLLIIDTRQHTYVEIHSAHTLIATANVKLRYNIQKILISRIVLGTPRIEAQLTQLNGENTGNNFNPGASAGNYNSNGTDSSTINWYPRPYNDGISGTNFVAVYSGVSFSNHLAKGLIYLI